MELVNLATIFEFFLVLYAGYMVSNEIKKVIDQKVIKLLKGYTDIVSNTQATLLELINNVREQCDYVESFAAPSSVNDNTPNSGNNPKVKNYIDKKRNRLCDLEEEITKRYDGSDPHSLFESETQFTNVFKPYSFYFTLYCFLMLCMNGYEPLLKDNAFYIGLFWFNIFSSVFLLIIFIMSLFSSMTIHNLIILTIFLGFLTSAIFIALPSHKSLLIGYDRDFAIIYSIGLVVSPILFYITRIQFSGAKFKSRITTEHGKYHSEIVIMLDQISKPAEYAPAYAEYHKMRTEGSDSNTDPQ